MLAGPDGKRIDTREKAARFFLRVCSESGLYWGSENFSTFDEDGSFRVRLDPCGPAWVTACMEDLGRSDPVAVELREGVVIDRLSFRVAVPKGTAIVLVRDSDGNPLDDARVVVAADTSGNATARAGVPAAPRGLWRSDWTDARGIARIDRIPEGRAAIGAAWTYAPGNARDTAQPGKDKRASTIAEIRGETHVMLELRDVDSSARCTLRAIVVPHDPDAVMSLFVDEDPEYALDDTPEALAESGPSLHCHGLVPGAYWLDVWSATHCGTARVMLAPGETREIAVPLAPWSGLRTTVDLGGTPLEYGRLALRGPRAEDIVGADGVFQDDVIVPGVYRATLRWPWAPRRDFTWELPDPIVVPPGGRTDRALALPTGSVELKLSLGGEPLRRGKARAFRAGGPSPVAEFEFDEEPLSLRAWPAGAYTLLFATGARAYLGMQKLDIRADASAALACDLAELPEAVIAVLLPDGTPAQRVHGDFSVNSGPCFRVEGRGRLAFRVPEGMLAGYVGAWDSHGFRVGPMKIARGAPNKTVVRLQPCGRIALADASICLFSRAFPHDAGTVFPGFEFASCPAERFGALLSPADFAFTIETGSNWLVCSPMLPAGTYRVVYPWLRMMRTATVEVEPGKVTLLRPDARDGFKRLGNPR